MKKNNLLPLLMAVILLSSMSPKEELDYKEILKESDFYRGGQIPGIIWDLQVQNIELDKLKNEITLKVEASAQDNQQFTLINFLKPKKYSGQKMLLRDNNMWFIKTGMRRPVPISGRQRLTGTASNADVATTNYYLDYNINETTNETVNGELCFVMELVAKNNLVSYSKIKYWIRQKDRKGIKAEYYAKSGKLIKIAYIEYNNIAEYQNIKHRFVSKVTITDAINKKDKTILNISVPTFKSFSNSKFQKNTLLD